MSDLVNEKRYQGNVQALILDWSGTTEDAYVVAPTVVFVEVFTPDPERLCSRRAEMTKIEEASGE